MYELNLAFGKWNHTQQRDYLVGRIEGLMWRIENLESGKFFDADPEAVVKARAEIVWTQNLLMSNYGMTIHAIEKIGKAA